VFLRTPNWAFIRLTYPVRSRVLQHDVRLGPLNHVVYFSARTLTYALRQAGFRSFEYRAFPPPQVRIVRAAADPVSTETSISLYAKNALAATADRIASASRGRVSVGSELDMFAATH
jgi:hypothetical protein